MNDYEIAKQQNQIDRMVELQTQQINRVLKAESSYNETQDKIALVLFYENLWTKEGLWFRGAKYPTRLSELYIELEQYEDALRALKYLKDYEFYSDIHHKAIQCLDEISKHINVGDSYIFFNQLNAKGNGQYHPHNTQNYNQMYSNPATIIPQQYAQQNQAAFNQLQQPKPSETTLMIAKISLIGLAVCFFLLIVCTDTLFAFSLFLYFCCSISLLITVPLHTMESRKQKTNVASGGCLAVIAVFFSTLIVFIISVFIHIGIYY